MNAKRFAEVAVPIPLEKQTYTYRIPMELQADIQIGSMVYVPFKHQKTSGFVVGFPATPPAGIELKSIIRLRDPEPVVDADMLKLTRWIADYYLCSWGEAINAAVPIPADSDNSPKPQTEEILVAALSLDQLHQKLDRLPQRNKRQRELIQLLIDYEGEVPRRVASEQGISRAVIRALVPDVLQIESREIHRNPFANLDVPDPPELAHTEAQQAVIQHVLHGIAGQQFEVVLLHGVTSSGKTEVYLESIKSTLRHGRTAIVLVPEISLTPQTIRRFKAHFGDQVAVLHSQLSPAERFDEWRRIRAGECPVVVGVRSAVFAPVKNLGLIVVDEEHESTYKQDNPDPRYHARDVAIMRAKWASAMVVLGSATPSLESYYNAKSGKYTLLELSQRIHSEEMPPVRIIDMREEWQARGFSLISTVLRDEIQQRLAREEQVIILINRRGFSTFVQCAHCGYVPHCPNCDISLTYHKRENRLRCHYCGHQITFTEKCRECHSPRLQYRGLGTQRIELVLQGMLPGHTRIRRMDLDTTRRKGAHDQILEAFRAGEIDILLGTQMIAKGLDFPKVTLVGVVSADTILNLPDFRAAERTFQLLAQVAGRTGRSHHGGEVVIQTLMPAHYSIQRAKEHDYTGFYEHEMQFRKELDYPPFSRFLRIIVVGTNETACIQIVTQLARAILKQKNEPFVEMLGPTAAPLAKIKRNYRWHILLKSTSSKALHQRVQTALQGFRTHHHVRVEIDVDPQHLL
ncbi:MAG: primosomal protein N' [Gemmatimonadetes bacterium]|nr:MAG: primosomal protein N' [Gemmatimonadota bacterium]